MWKIKCIHFFAYVVIGIEPRASYILGKYTTTEPHLLPILRHLNKLTVPSYSVPETYQQKAHTSKSHTHTL